MNTLNLSNYRLVNKVVNKIAENVCTEDKAALQQLVELGIIDIAFDGKEVSMKVKCDELEKLLEVQLAAQLAV